MADGSIKIDLDLEIKTAEQKLETLKKKTSEMAGEINKTDSNNIDKLAESYQQTINKTKEALAQAEQYNKEILRSSRDMAEYQSIGDMQGVQAMETRIAKYQQLLDSTNLVTQELNAQGIQADNYIAKLDGINVRQDRQKASTQQITDDLRRRTGVTEDNITKTKELRDGVDDVKASVEQTTKSSRGMGSAIGKSVTSIRRMTLALFGARSAYTLLSKITREWLNSADVGAQNVKASIGQITTALTNVLAPVLTAISNIVMTMLTYINAFLKAFFGINLFAKSTDKSVGGIGGGIKDANKEMKKFTASFDKAEVISEDLTDNMGGGGGGGAVVDTPTLDFDTSRFDEVLQKIKDDLKPFLDMIKEIDWQPMIDSFNDLKTAGKTTLNILYKSFIRLMNEAVAPFIKLMAEDIVPKGLNTITRIVNLLNPIFEKLLINFVEPLFKWFLLEFVPKGLELVFSVLEAIGGLIAVVLESFNFFYELIGKEIFWLVGQILTGALDILKIIFDKVNDAFVFFLEKLEEGDPLAQAIATAIGAIVTALLLYYGAMLGVNIVTGIFAVLNPFALAAISVGLLITAILLLYAHWEEIAEFFGTSLDGIKGEFTKLGTNIKKVWDAMAPNMMEGITNVINLFKGMFSDITGFLTEWIPPFIEKIMTFVNNVMTTFSPLFEFVSQLWRDITGIMLELWEEYGEPILDEFGEFINNMVDTFNRIWTDIVDPILTPAIEMMQKLWDDHIKDLVENVGGMIGDLILGALKIYNEVFKPIVDWIVDFLSPKIEWLAETIFPMIGDAVGGAIDFISDLITDIRRIFNGLVDFITGVFEGDWEKAWNGVTEIFGGAFDTLKTMAKSPLNFVIRMLNKAFDGLNKLQIPNWVPFIGGKGLNFPKIPELAKGGVLTRPTLNVAGEYAGARSNPEIVTPESLMRKIVNEELSRTGNNGGGNMQPQIIQLVVDGKKLAEIVNDNNKSSTISRNGALAWNM